MSNVPAQHESPAVRAEDLGRVTDVVLAHIDERGWLPADRRAFAEAVADAALRAALGGPQATSIRAMCVTWGHESIPATTSGILDDGDEQTSASYCAECTAMLARDGEYTVLERHPDSEQPAQSGAVAEGFDADAAVAAIASDIPAILEGVRALDRRRT